MQNENTPAEGLNSAQTESESALRGAACSPSVSDTPETDEKRIDVSGCATAVIDMTEHARKLERERNSAIAALMAIEERYIDGCDTYEDWKFIGGIARSFFEENEKGMALGAPESPLK